MATKSSSVTARMDQSLKSEAEDILEKIGLNSSIAINALYKQIVYHRGIPFSLTVPNELEYNREKMSENEFAHMMERGYTEAIAGKGRNASEVYEDLINDLKDRANV